MKEPGITLRCDCGAEGKVKYGERWTCESCGRVYDTSQIPSQDYAEIAALDRRYRVGVWAVMAVLAIAVLAVALTRQVIPIFAGLAVVMLSWFLYIKPLVHRRHKAAVSRLTRTWNVEAEPE
jgi:ABC-type transport system involved in cytochrome bd biosynthesis fused ATPase/permease subunit